MTPDEVVELLSFAQAIDRRNVGDAETAAWSAMLADTDAADAALVVRKHFQTSTEWLMPVHIVQGVKDLRGARLDAYGFVEDAEDYDESAPGAVDWIVHHRERCELVASGRMVRGPRGRGVLVVPSAKAVER
jgi:hypothetical protein